MQFSNLWEKNEKIIKMITPKKLLFRLLLGFTVAVGRLGTVVWPWPRGSGETGAEWGRFMAEGSSRRCSPVKGKIEVKFPKTPA